MPSLGDFLGALLSDAARARVRADVEMLRLAQLYSKDPLLKNLPVPRFRLPDITVDVPMLVTQLTGGSALASGLPFEEPTAAELRDVARAGLRAAGVRLPREVAPRIPSELVRRAQEYFASGSLRLLNPTSVAEDLASRLVDVVSSAGVAVTDEQAHALRTATAEAAVTLITGRLRLSLSWQVAVTAEELKAQDHPNSVVHLRLTVSEDGYEVIERAGGESFFLTPE